MNAQLAIDFEAARAARDAGMQRALDHANDVSPDWGDRAYDALVKFAATRPTFTALDFRMVAVGYGLDKPPTAKAFGGIFAKACKRGVIRKIGYAPHSERHQSPTVVWEKAA